MNVSVNNIGPINGSAAKSGDGALLAVDTSAAVDTTGLTIPANTSHVKFAALGCDVRFAFAYTPTTAYGEKLAADTSQTYPVGLFATMKFIAASGSGNILWEPIAE